MKKDLLLDALTKADGIEESSVGALSNIMSFYLDRQFNFGLPKEKLDELKDYLTILKNDSLKHKRLVQEAIAYVTRGDEDDY